MAFTKSLFPYSSLPWFLKTSAIAKTKMERDLCSLQQLKKVLQNVKILFFFSLTVILLLVTFQKIAYSIWQRFRVVWLINTVLKYSKVIEISSSKKKQQRICSPRKLSSSKSSVSSVGGVTSFSLATLIGLLAMDARSFQCLRLLIVFNASSSSQNNWKQSFKAKKWLEYFTNRYLLRISVEKGATKLWWRNFAFKILVLPQATYPHFQWQLYNTASFAANDAKGTQVATGNKPVSRDNNRS